MTDRQPKSVTAPHVIPEVWDKHSCCWCGVYHCGCVACASARPAPAPEAPPEQYWFDMLIAVQQIRAALASPAGGGDAMILEPPRSFVSIGVTFFWPPCWSVWFDESGLGVEAGFVAVTVTAFFAPQEEPRR